jgi:hypothetical protein
VVCYAAYSRNPKLGLRGAWVSHTTQACTMDEADPDHAVGESDGAPMRREARCGPAERQIFAMDVKRTKRQVDSGTRMHHACSSQSDQVLPGCDCRSTNHSGGRETTEVVPNQYRKLPARCADAPWRKRPDISGMCQPATPRVPASTSIASHKWLGRTSLHQAK